MKASFDTNLKQFSKFSPIHILVVKLSSLGDVVHTLPALTDLKAAYPNCKIDWVVESGFSEIPAWHPAINKVIAIDLRKWRKNIFCKKTYASLFSFMTELKTTQYDVIIDAQGLVKSGLVSKFARGKKRIGLDKDSAKEAFSSFFYNEKINVPWGQHAIDRVRQLFAKAFGYSYSEDINYGLNETFSSSALSAVLSNDLVSATATDMVPHITNNIPNTIPTNSVFLLHGTTWDTKHYPRDSWLEVSKILNKEGFQCVLSYGNDAEKENALWLQSQNPNIIVLPKMSLSKLAAFMHQAVGVISVDTGLAHVAAALHLPTLSLYGPTNPEWTGTKGPHQQHMRSELACAPCLRKKCQFNQQNKDEAHKGDDKTKKANTSQIHFKTPCFEEQSPLKIVMSFTALIKETMA